LENVGYRDELEALLASAFVPAGYKLTRAVEFDSGLERPKYDALHFSLNNKNIVYRKGKVTPDRPGAFLAIWQRPLSGNVNGNKPIPLTSSELDYLFIKVESHSNLSEEFEHNQEYGMFVFPVSLLVERGIVSSTNSKGKTGFRVFPPWSQDRGVNGTKVFSDSGKKTQRWQLEFFLEIDANGSIDSRDINRVLSYKGV